MNIFNTNIKKEIVYNNSLIATIAHSIMVSTYPELSFEQSWDGYNYNTQESDGTKSTISFHPTGLVAASFYPYSISKYNGTDFFNLAGDEVLNIAKDDTLQYLLQKINGDVVPVISSGLWEVNNNIYTPEFTFHTLNNDFPSLERLLLEFEDAIEFWAEYYDMSDNQVNFLIDIYNKKLNYNKEIIIPNSDIYKFECDNKKGLLESYESFKEIGIIVEIEN